jgi:Collagen triple helix repeat (20 copies)
VFRRPASHGGPAFRRTIVACVVTALVVGTGTASAAKLITSKDIEDGSIQNRDLAEGVISLSRLSPGVQALIARQARDGVDGKDGVDGQDGADGRDGADGANGANGTNGANGQDGLSSDTPRVVMTGDLRGWTLQPRGDGGDTSDNGTLIFGTPSATPPLGASALNFTAVTGKTVVAYLPLPAGTVAAFATGPHPKLNELTTAGYSSLANGSPAATSDVIFQMEVLGANVTGTGNGYTTLNFEPSGNGKTANTGSFMRWNVRAGKVWSSRAPLSGSECGAGAPCTLSRFMELHPNATVHTVKLKIGQNNGTGWTGFSGWVDDVRLGFDGLAVRWDLGA